MTLVTHGEVNWGSQKRVTKTSLPCPISFQFHFLSTPEEKRSSMSVYCCALCNGLFLDPVFCFWDPDAMRSMEDLSAVNQAA